MSKQSADSSLVTNRLLARLPEPEWQKLLPHLKRVPLAFKKILYETDAPVDYAYFPNQGMISVVTYMEDGMGSEVATIGREGVAGLPPPWGTGTAIAHFFVQIAGEALRVQLRALKELAVLDSPLGQLLAQYQAVFFRQIAQGSACNGLHTVVQRCCRWLLMTQDRIQSDELPLTHEFLAQMLGVRRSSVTEVLLPIQGAGMIRTQRGKITVLNRSGLEETSCECYRVVAEAFGPLLSENGGRTA